MKISYPQSLLVNKCMHPILRNPRAVNGHVMVYLGVVMESCTQSLGHEVEEKLDW